MRTRAWHLWRFYFASDTHIWNGWVGRYQDCLLVVVPNTVIYLPTPRWHGWEYHTPISSTLCFFRTGGSPLRDSVLRAPPSLPPPSLTTDRPPYLPYLTSPYCMLCLACYLQLALRRPFPLPPPPPPSSSLLFFLSFLLLHLLHLLQSCSVDLLRRQYFSSASSSLPAA